MCKAPGTTHPSLYAVTALVGMQSLQHTVCWPPAQGGLCSSRCTVYPQHHVSGKKMPLSRQLQEKSTLIWFCWLWLDYSSVQNSSNSGWSGCTVPISWAGEVLFKAVSLHSLRRCMGWLWNGALGFYLWKKKRTLSSCTEACEEVWVGSRTSASSSLWKPKATTK